MKCRHCEYIADLLHEFRRLKKIADRSLSQVDDEMFFRTLDAESNSLAVLVKHMSGNMLSRWRDFLTTDGEKPDRNRDSEFIIAPEEDRALLQERWNAGWDMLYQALQPLKPEDMQETVLIRKEPHTVPQAINRQLTHYAYHVGQIVFLARHILGTGWLSLSVPRGMSESFNRSPEAYRGPGIA